MPSLEELINQSLSGIIEGGGLPTEEALYGRQALAERENLSARGLGISTVTRDALAKARVDAALAAQNAQLAALGQAAGVTQGNLNRAQQATQFNQQMDQRKREMSQQESMANKQMLAGGLGAGAGAALQIGGMAFAPEIRSNLRGLFGLGANASPISPAGGREVMAPPVPAMDTGATGDLGALANYSMPDTSFGGMDVYSDPGFDFGGSLDLGSLFDFGGFDPYQVQDWGWY